MARRGEEIPGMSGLCWSDLPLDDDEIYAWQMSGVFDLDDDGESETVIDGHRTMIPTPGVTRQRRCDRCGFDIEPLEPHHTSRLTGVRWCDSCFEADCDAD